MKFLAWLFFHILKLRYRFHIKGLDLVKDNQGQLILPSHVALVDPMILFAVLSQKCKVHPVVTSSFFENPILKPFFKLIGAVGIGDFEADQGSKENVTGVIKNLLQQIEKKQAILLYPQGALARQGFQVLNGKKTAYEITKNAPKRSKILTVSIKGLRGSRSSYAWTGKSPNLFLFFLKGIGFALLNGLFFIPKRDVFITIENQTNSLKKIAQKGIDDFNTTLEHVYNQGEEEKIHYLSGLFYLNTVRHHPIPSKIVGSIEDLKSAKDFSQEVLDNEVQTFVIHKIKEIKPDFQEEISVNSNVVLDLMFDSLDVAELKSSVLAHFPKSSNTPLSHLKLVGDFILMGMGKGEQEGLKPCDWKYIPLKQTLYAYLKDTVKESSTLLDSMKKTFKHCKKDQTTFCYDTLLGIQTFKDFLLKVYVIAELIKQKNSGKYVAIMLPSLSATALLITACYFAGKIPVMLNWTQSEQAFASCVKQQELTMIFTAKTFFNTLQSPRLQQYQFAFIEDLLKDIPLGIKLKGLLKSLFFILPHNIPETAVVLFTSGSESLPKAVHLSHQNILQDLVGVLGLVDIGFSDVILGFLPPFHSFGFTITTILPLVTGVRVVFSPDPNDSSQLVRLINHTKASFLPSTPTFLRGILQTAKEDQISSLKFAVVGAEKASDDVFALFAKRCPKGKILEGYGITECSPVISVNPFQRNKKVKKGSVGLPILGLDLLIQDLKTKKEAGVGKEGMIYVSGKSIFSGYVDSTLENPFETINGTSYYKTGDLGYVDEDGYLYISGRMKRFVKIAGEMISLPAIEQLLFQKYGDGLCVEAKELESGKVKFVLFSAGENYDLNEVNQVLSQGGIPHLVEIQEVRVLEELPILGTGKTDFMKLRNMI